MRREALQKVREHFIVQGNPPSIDIEASETEILAGSQCRYDGPNGARCAFAIQLTDEELAKIAEEGYEGKCATFVIDKLNLQRFQVKRSTIKSPEGEYLADPFYDELQSCHDYAAKHAVYDEGDFKELLEAGLNNLERDFPPEPETVDAS